MSTDQDKLLTEHNTKFKVFKSLPWLDIETYFSKLSNITISFLSQYCVQKCLVWHGPKSAMYSIAFLPWVDCLSKALKMLAFSVHMRIKEMAPKLFIHTQRFKMFDFWCFNIKMPLNTTTWPQKPNFPSRCNMRVWLYLPLHHKQRFKNYSLL